MSHLLGPSRGTFTFFPFVFSYFSTSSIRIHCGTAINFVWSRLRLLRDLFPAKICVGYVFFRYRTLRVASDDDTDRIPSRSLTDGSWLGRILFFFLNKTKSQGTHFRFLLEFPIKDRHERFVNGVFSKTSLHSKPCLTFIPTSIYR